MVLRMEDEKSLDTVFKRRCAGFLMTLREFMSEVAQTLARILVEFKYQKVIFLKFENSFLRFHVGSTAQNRRLYSDAVEPVSKQVWC